MADILKSLATQLEVLETRQRTVRSERSAALETFTKLDQELEWLGAEILKTSNQLISEQQKVLSAAKSKSRLKSTACGSDTPLVDSAASTLVQLNGHLSPAAGSKMIRQSSNIYGTDNDILMIDQNSRNGPRSPGGWNLSPVYQQLSEISLGPGLGPAAQHRGQRRMWSTANSSEEEEDLLNSKRLKNALNRSLSFGATEKDQRRRSSATSEIMEATAFLESQFDVLAFQTLKELEQPEASLKDKIASVIKDKENLVDPSYVPSKSRSKAKRSETAPNISARVYLPKTAVRSTSLDQPLGIQVANNNRVTGPTGQNGGTGVRMRVPTPGITAGVLCGGSSGGSVSPCSPTVSSCTTGTSRSNSISSPPLLPPLSSHPNANGHRRTSSPPSPTSSSGSSSSHTLTQSRIQSRSEHRLVSIDDSLKTSAAGPKQNGSANTNGEKIVMLRRKSSDLSSTSPVATSPQKPPRNKSKLSLNSASSSPSSSVNPLNGSTADLMNHSSSHGLLSTTAPVAAPSATRTSPLLSKSPLTASCYQNGGSLNGVGSGGILGGDLSLSDSGPASSLSPPPPQAPISTATITINSTTPCVLSSSSVTSSRSSPIKSMYAKGSGAQNSSNGPSSMPYISKSPQFIKPEVRIAQTHALPELQRRLAADSSPTAQLGTTNNLNPAANSPVSMSGGSHRSSPMNGGGINGSGGSGSRYQSLTDSSLSSMTSGSSSGPVSANLLIENLTEAELENFDSLTSDSGINSATELKEVYSISTKRNFWEKLTAAGAVGSSAAAANGGCGGGGQPAPNGFIKRTGSSASGSAAGGPVGPNGTPRPVRGAFVRNAVNRMTYPSPK